MAADSQTSADALDAARYRWLRNNHAKWSVSNDVSLAESKFSAAVRLNYFKHVPGMVGGNPSLDAAIDAEIAAAAGKP